MYIRTKKKEKKKREHLINFNHQFAPEKRKKKTKIAKN